MFLPNRSIAILFASLLGFANYNNVCMEAAIHLLDFHQNLISMIDAVLQACYHAKGFIFLFILKELFSK